MLQQIKFLLFIYFPTKIIVESATCEWIGGASGSQITCLPGWLVTGLCGSGRSPLCKDGFNYGSRYYYMLQCCDVKDTKDQFQTYQVTGAAGSSTTCDVNGTVIDPMVGGCGSGQKNSCRVDGTTYTNVAICAESSSFNLGPVSSCSWRYEQKGQPQTCPSGYYLAGSCGSNQYANCAQGSAMTGIYCCPLM